MGRCHVGPLCYTNGLPLDPSQVDPEDIREERAPFEMNHEKAVVRHGQQSTCSTNPRGVSHGANR